MTHFPPPPYWKTNTALWAAALSFVLFSGAHIIDLVKADAEQSLQIRINTERLTKLEGIAQTVLEAANRQETLEMANQRDHAQLKASLADIQIELQDHERNTRRMLKGHPVVKGIP